jgi:hypothetical protein
MIAYQIIDLTLFQNKLKQATSESMKERLQQQIKSAQDQVSVL